MSFVSVDNIFIYPTDTVWGVGASIYSNKANNEIRSIKGADCKKALSVLFRDFDQLQSFFRLPKFLTKSWARNFFSLETTILIPKERLIKEIPYKIIFDSQYIGCRCLNFIMHLDYPLTTTSLNISGCGPIIDEEKASSFMQNYFPKAKFINPLVKLSGRSSTIVSIDNEGKIKIIRRGEKAVEVEKLCRLHST